MSSIDEIKQEISIHTDWLCQQLEEFRLQTKLSGKLNNGCWANENGVIVGWVGYCPHNDQAEDNIELVFWFSENENKDKCDFDVGVCWTDGSMIHNIAENDNIDIDNAISRIKIIIEQEKTRSLAEMKKQMLIDRPPYYHDEYK